MGRTKQRGAAPPELVRSASGSATSEIGSIGRYLARERAVREISLEELAALTRLPQRSLERLESGYLDGVHDGFTRGLVRTVSEALGLHVEDTVARMLPEAERPAPRTGVPTALRWLGVVPVVGWAAGVVLLVLGIWFARATIAPPPEPLLYRQDAVRELWLLQQQHSSWSPAPALTTSPVPTVEPEGTAVFDSETRDEH